jgi:hypothetical protein
MTPKFYHNYAALSNNCLVIASCFGSLPGSSKVYWGAMIVLSLYNEKGLADSESFKGVLRNYDYYINVYNEKGPTRL